MSIDKKRKEVDELDDKIIKYLDKRFEITQEIGKIKKQNNIEVLNQKREEEIMRKIKNTAILSYEEVKDVYAYIIDVSKKRQNDE